MYNNCILLLTAEAKNTKEQLQYSINAEVQLTLDKKRSSFIWKCRSSLNGKCKKTRWITDKTNSSKRRKTCSVKRTTKCPKMLSSLSMQWVIHQCRASPFNFEWIVLTKRSHRAIEPITRIASWMNSKHGECVIMGHCSINYDSLFVRISAFAELNRNWKQWVAANIGHRIASVANNEEQCAECVYFNISNI